MAGYLDDDNSDPAMAAPSHDSEVAAWIALGLDVHSDDDAARSRLEDWVDRQRTLTTLTRRLGGRR